MFSQIHSNGTLCVKYNTPDKIPPTRSKYTQASIKMLVLSDLSFEIEKPQVLFPWFYVDLLWWAVQDSNLSPLQRQCSALAK